MPFQRGIADAIGDPLVERVTVLKCVRIGYTTLLTSAALSFAANDPSPMIMVQPTEDDCRDYVVSDLEPIAEATPATRGLLAAGADGHGRSTLTHRRFPGGFLKLLAARAPRNLRRHNARILLIDEEDGFEVTKEGDPVALSINRTLQFANRKIVRGSTPTGGEQSSIMGAYAESNRGVYRLPCLSCGERFQPMWPMIKWAAGRPASAELECPMCAAMIPHNRKAELIEAGDWFVRSPEVTRHMGFHLNILVSPLPNATWGQLAVEWEAAQGAPEKLRPFVETYLAETWSEAVDRLDHDDLHARREAIGLGGIDEETGEVLDCPADVLMLTMGVDVQRDRLEATILGFAPPDEEDGIERVDILAHHVIWGDPKSPSTWNELDELVGQTWAHPLGGRIAIERVAVDSGDGETTDDVYAYCWGKPGQRVMAIKGLPGKGPWIKASSGKVSKGRLRGAGRLWTVYVDGVKGWLYTVIGRERFKGAVRFSSSLPEDWFEQLVGEQRVMKRRGGRLMPVFEPVRDGAPHEALDCVVYALAARRSVTVLDADARRKALAGETRRARKSFAAYGS